MHHEYDHLFESAKQDMINRSIHDEETNVMREKTRDHLVCTTSGICIYCEAEKQQPLKEYETLRTDPNYRPGMSSWVRRNIEGAQYAQPRGSQYEG